MTAEDGIAIATYRITSAYTGYSLYLTVGRKMHTKLCPFTWVSGFPSNIWCLSPVRVHIPNGTAAVCPYYGFKIMANRHTETNTVQANTKITLYTYTQPFYGPFSGTTRVSRYQQVTRSSAIAEGPRDASCQLKYYQLPHNSAKTTCTTSPEQIEVTKLEGLSGPMCNKHVHSTMTRSSRFHCLIGVINKPTKD